MRPLKSSNNTLWRSETAPGPRRQQCSAMELSRTRNSLPYADDDWKLRMNICKPLYEHLAMTRSNVFELEIAGRRLSGESNLREYGKAYGDEVCGISGGKRSTV